MNTLTLRFSAVAMLATVLAVAVALSLNHVKFRQTMTDLTVERIDFLARDIATGVQLGLDLGLALETMENVPALLARTKALDPGISDIWVVDAAGRVVHASDGAGRVRVPLAATLEGFDRQEDETAITVFGPLSNELGQTVGAVGIRYDTAHTRAAVAAMLSDLLAAAGAILLVVLAPVLPVVWLAYRAIGRRLARLHRRLAMRDGLEAGAEDDLARLAARAAGTIEAAERSLAEAPR